MNNYVNIPLNVLDEYAQVLSISQANKLYESKTGKIYTKQLFEDNTLRMKLDPITIFKQTHMAKTQFVFWLNENYQSLMNNISYKMTDDGIEFKTYDRNVYRKLQESLRTAGFSSEAILILRDEKY